VARASLCTVLHVEGLVTVFAARASPCTLHVRGLVTVCAARASPCTLHVGGLVTVFAARASPCTLHVGGLVTVCAARASPCTLHVGGLVTVSAASSRFSCTLVHAEGLGGRVPSLGEDTKCVPSLSGDTRSMPQKIAGMVMHPEDGVDSTLRVSLLGRYTEGQEMSSSKVDEDAPASAGCGIMVVPSWSGNTVSMPPRVAGLVVHLGDGVDSTLRFL